MSHTPYVPAGPLHSDDVDEHRFAPEQKKTRGGRYLVLLAAGLVISLAVIGIGGYFAKGAYERYAAERAERKKKEAEKNASANMRRSRAFAEGPPASASTPQVGTPLPGASAALPQGFGQRKETGGALAIPLASTPDPAPHPAGAAPAATRPVAKPTMMVGETDGTGAPSSATPPSTQAPYLPSASGAASMPVGVGQSPAATLPNGQAAAATVQQAARAQALKATGVTSTAQSSAAKLGDRSVLLARGAFIPCVLETDLNSNVPGPVSCVATGHVYSDDGRAVLIEKGSRIQGEYRNTLKQGDTRISVLWNRIKTPDGVVVDVDSPASDGTGAIGVEGVVDEHWMKRIGAAFLLSVVQDVVQANTSRQGSGGTTINTNNNAKSVAEKVLDSTINIPPTLYKNRGERLMVMVNRDLWFDGVYALEKKR